MNTITIGKLWRILRASESDVIRNSKPNLRESYRSIFLSLKILIIINAAINSVYAQELKLVLPIGHTGSVSSAVFSSDGKKILTSSLDGTSKVWDAQSGALILDLKGHSDYVKSAVFSPDGKRIVTSSGDRTAKVWDAQNGALQLDLKGHSDYVESAVFSPDGKRILTSSGDGTAKVWNSQTGNLLLELKGHLGFVNSAVFSHEGDKILTSSNDKTAMVWDAQTGALLLELKGHEAWVESAVFSPDGKKILTASNDRTAKVWNSKNGSLELDLKGHSDYVESAVFSPDGKKVLTASLDKTAKLWDTQSGALMLDLNEHSDYVYSAIFSPDGKKVLTASLDKTAKLWDTQSGRLELDLKGHSDKVKTAIFSPDGRKILTVSDDKSSKVWDTQNGAFLIVLKGYSCSIKSGVFSPDGDKILTASNDRTAMVWDAQTGALLLELKGHEAWVESAVFSPDGKKILTASDDRTAKVWNSKNGALMLDLKGHSRSLNSALFSPDGKKILTASNDSTAKVWDSESGALMLDLKGHSAWKVSAIYSPDEKRIFTSSQDKTAKVWDAQSGNLILELKEYSDHLTSALFSPDGKKIMASRYKTAKVWDVQSGAIILDLKGHSNWLVSAVFSSDGKKILTASNDSTAKVWNSESGALMLDLKGHSDRLVSAVFSPDGKKILTCSIDKTAKVWDAQTGKLLRNLEGHSERIASSQFSPDGKKILTASWDNTVKIWDAENGELQYSFIALDSSDFLVVDKDYRYDGTVRARKLLYFTCGSEVIGLEQLKDKLWVPGLAQRINNGESINSPKLSELNLCGLIPMVKTNDTEDSASYSFTIVPQRGGLGSIDLLVNGIPTLKFTPEQLTKTSEGFQLTISKKTLSPFLTPGQSNPVTVIARTSDNTITSRGAQLVAQDSGRQVIPNLYAVVVGVSTYKGDGLKLNYAAKDAQDFGNAISLASKKLLNQDGKDHVFVYNFNTDNTDKYRKGYPDKISIQRIFDTIAAKARKTDILLVFFAGHGVVEQPSTGNKANKKQFYFLTSDASSFNDVSNTGISTMELIEWMHPSKMKAQKRILVLDACNSGEAINEISKNTELMAVRNTDQQSEKKEIERLNDEAGMFIMSASASNQSAYELARYSQGLLTYTLLKAIKQQPDILQNGKYLDLSRWFTAAKKSVNDITNQMSIKGRQEPQVITNTNFSIGIVDPDVRDQIKLADEKPIFTRSEFKNADSPTDNLRLRNLVDKQLQNESSRGADNKILYESAFDGSEGYTLSGDYTINGNDITIAVYLIKGGTTLINKKPWQIKGTVDKLEDLAKAIAQKAIEAVND